MSAICETLTCAEAQLPIETLFRQALAKDAAGCIGLRMVSDATPGGSTALYYDLTEAAAITAIGAQTLEIGAMYRISLDGTSSGTAGDGLYVLAIDVDSFARTMDYLDSTNVVFGTVQGIFNGSGFAFTAADPTLTGDDTNMYKFDTATDELQLDGFTTTYLYGIVEIGIAGAETLETITGGFEGMELTIFVTGGGANVLNVANTGNIIFDGSGFTPTPPYGVLDNNTAYVKLKKRGSNWIALNWLLI